LAARSYKFQRRDGRCRSIGLRNPARRSQWTLDAIKQRGFDVTRKGEPQMAQQNSSGKRSKTAPKRRTARSAPNAIAMLREDHKRVQEMFDRFEKTRDGERKQKLVEQICHELEIHTQLEEEIVYPAVRAAIGDDDLMDEATVEHQSAKDLIDQLRGMEPDDELYDAKVTVLGEYIKHHGERGTRLGVAVFGATF
jgi:hypothetical protein